MLTRIFSWFKPKPPGPPPYTLPPGTPLLFSFTEEGPKGGCIVAFDLQTKDYVVANDTNDSVFHASQREVWNWSSAYKKWNSR